MANEPTYYELLGVDVSASLSEIQAAGRSLSKSAHPDAGGNAGLFRMVRVAHDTLTDPVQRAAYDHLHGLSGVPTDLVDPDDLMAYAELAREQGRLGAARIALQRVLTSGDPTLSALVQIGLGGVERDAGDLAASREAYAAAAQMCDAATLPSALTSLADVDFELGNIEAAREAYHQAIATGDALMTPSALLGLGELEEHAGNVHAARAAYQLTIGTGDVEFTAVAAAALRTLERSLQEFAERRSGYR